MVIGFKNEGWFDPWILLSGFKKKAISLGVEYISGEVVGMNVDNERVKSVKVGRNRSMEPFWQLQQVSMN